MSGEQQAKFQMYKCLYNSNIFERATNAATSDKNAA